MRQTIDVLKPYREQAERKSRELIDSLIKNKIWRKRNTAQITAT